MDGMSRAGEIIVKCVAAIREQFAYADKAKAVLVCAEVIKNTANWEELFDFLRAHPKLEYFNYSNEEMIEEITRQAAKQAAPADVGGLVEASVSEAARLLKSDPVATPEETVPLFQKMWGAAASAVANDFIESLRGTAGDRIRQMAPEKAEHAAWMLLGARALLRIENSRPSNVIEELNGVEFSDNSTACRKLSPDEFIAAKSQYEFDQLMAELVHVLASETKAYGHFSRDLDKAGAFIVQRMHAKLGPLLEACMRRAAERSGVSVGKTTPEIVDMMLTQTVAAILDRAFQLDSTVDNGADSELNALANSLVGKKVGMEFSADGKVVRYMPVEEAQRKIAAQDLAAKLKRIADIAAQCVLPPQTSAQNVEVAAMSYATFAHALRDSGFPSFDGWEMPLAVRRLLVGAEQFIRACGFDPTEIDVFDAKNHIVKFLGLWRQSAFARLEVSHKLAAALCLTDIEDNDDIHAPWAAWSLLIPDGLFGTHVSAPARVWCLGKSPIVVLSNKGITRWDSLCAWSEKEKIANAGMILSLVLGTCAALATPDRIKRRGSWGASKSKRERRDPLSEGARFILSHPVSIDLRHEVLESLGNIRRRTSAAPKVQFLVRGHWRNQAHGPGHTLRTLKWIEPFWKGPEDTRVLLRAYKVEE